MKIQNELKTVISAEVSQFDGEEGRWEMGKQKPTHGFSLEVQNGEEGLTGQNTERAGAGAENLQPYYFRSDRRGEVLANSCLKGRH